MEHTFRDPDDLHIMASECPSATWLSIS